jgi:hypothetical protein
MGIFGIISHDFGHCATGAIFLLALLALLPSECRKPMEPWYLYLLVYRATVALFGPVRGPVTAVWERHRVQP